MKRLTFAAGFALALAGSALAQTVPGNPEPAVDFSVFFPDSDHPATLKPADLDPKMRAFKITGETSTNLLDMIMNPMMMLMGAFSGSSAPSDPAAANALQAIELAWSKGEIVSFGGYKFLVIYKPGIDLNSMMTSVATAPPDLAATKLQLQYVRIDSIKAVVPRIDMTKEAYLKILATKIKPAEPKKEAPSPK